MESNRAIQSFTALGHPGRLGVFRLLMRLAPHGSRPTEIAETLAMKQNTLSHHLGELVAAGLIRAERQGRSLFYSVDLDRAGSLVGYLVNDCCRGRPDICAQLWHQGGKPAMSQRLFNVLFICTGNSARSIMAEALLRDLGEGRFIAHSAGVHPNSALNPFTLEILARNDHEIGSLRSKHLSEYQTAEAPVMDFVFTVCDSAAAEECPPWPGQPISGHWGLPDPVKAEGTPAEKGLVFARTYGALHRRIEAFTALPFERLDRIALQRDIDRIGLDPT
jgi:protein-tyrosine-phosphatase